MITNKNNYGILFQAREDEIGIDFSGSFNIDNTNYKIVGIQTPRVNKLTNITLTDVNNNTFVGFFYKTKKNNKNEPDYIGKITFNEKEREIKGWIRFSAKNVQYLNLKIT